METYGGRNSSVIQGVAKKKRELFFKSFILLNTTISMFIPFKVLSGRAYAALHSRFTGSKTTA
jgi:hypothetical protein